MFTELKIWDTFVMTNGSVVQLRGRTCEGEEFSGGYYKIKSTSYDKLTVVSAKNKGFDIWIHDIDDDPDIGVVVKMISQVPYVMPF